jgi:SAM-dependent methyltransferase
MSNLHVIALSLLSPGARSAVQGFLASGEVQFGGFVVCPQTLDVALPASLRAIRYPGQLGIERSPGIFADLRKPAPWETIVVLGSQPLNDFEEIVLVSFLDAQRKLYLDGAGGVQDIAVRWQPFIRTDFSSREVRVARSPEADARRYVWYFHKWIEAEFARADYGLPARVAERRPDALIYDTPRLAQDLAQQTLDLDAEVQIADFRSSFSTLMMSDRSFVRTADYYRSMANFIAAVPGVESILDVGCGSGQLTCHMARLSTYRSVMGVDAAVPRVEGARLHAELAGIRSVEFRQMSMDRLHLPDRSVDMVVTSFALEQVGDALGRVLAELRRVARKFLILFEPTTEYFSSLASHWHIPESGWANSYFRVLSEAGVSYAVRPVLLGHYFNTGSVFVVDLQSPANPVVSLPQLSRPGPRDWPGGIVITESPA